MADYNIRLQNYLPIHDIYAKILQDQNDHFTTEDLQRMHIQHEKMNIEAEQPGSSRFFQILSTEEFNRFLPRLGIDWPDWLETLDTETFYRELNLAMDLTNSVERVFPHFMPKGQSSGWGAREYATLSSTNIIYPPYH